MSGGPAMYMNCASVVGLASCERHVLYTPANATVTLRLMVSPTTAPVL